jgi:hypothetical protein
MRNKLTLFENKWSSGICEGDLKVWRNNYEPDSITVMKLLLCHTLVRSVILIITFDANQQFAKFPLAPVLLRA